MQAGVGSARAGEDTGRPESSESRPCRAAAPAIEGAPNGGREGFEGCVGEAFGLLQPAMERLQKSRRRDSQPSSLYRAFSSAPVIDGAAFLQGVHYKKQQEQGCTRTESSLAL